MFSCGVGICCLLVIVCFVLDRELGFRKTEGCPRILSDQPLDASFHERDTFFYDRHVPINVRLSVLDRCGRNVAVEGAGSEVCCGSSTSSSSPPSERESLKREGESLKREFQRESREILKREQSSREIVESQRV